MEAGRQPITFENPLYATAPALSGDPAVIHATQVLINDLFISHMKHINATYKLPEEKQSIAANHILHMVQCFSSFLVYITSL